jgi:hypothetical protein
MYFHANIRSVDVVHIVFGVTLLTLSIYSNRSLARQLGTTKLQLTRSANLAANCKSRGQHHIDFNLLQFSSTSRLHRQRIMQQRVPER